jgi:hypothetical protein
MPWALASPAPGSVYDALLHELSFLRQEDCIAAGTLKWCDADTRKETESTVLLVPAWSALWVQVRKRQEQKREQKREQVRVCGPGAAALWQRDDTVLESKLAGPLLEGEMLVVRLMSE